MIDNVIAVLSISITLLQNVSKHFTGKSMLGRINKPMISGNDVKIKQSLFFGLENTQHT
jgi:hypothetical protein